MIAATSVSTVVASSSANRRATDAKSPGTRPGTLARSARSDSASPFAIGLFGLAMAKRFRLPYVHTYHTLYPEYVHYVWDTVLTREPAERLSRDFCNQCDTVIAPSTKISRALTEWGVRKPVITLPTGVDTFTFSERDPEAVEAFRRRFRIPSGDRLLTFVGRLGLEKNVDALIDAMSFVRAPGARLLVVGDGPYREKLERKYAGNKRVLFTGKISHDKLPEVYSACDIFVFPSTTDTFGMSVLEAQACGLPALVSDAGGPQEIIREGETGFAARACDPKDWEEKLTYMVNLCQFHPERFEELKKNSWVNIHQNYNWNDCVRRLFDETIAGGSADSSFHQEIPFLLKAM